MPAPWLFDLEPTRCPCCDKEVPLRVWEANLATAAMIRMPDWTGGPPRRVLCVSAYGAPVREGYAVMYRCCGGGGVVDIGILARPDDWNHGWWWPLGRVLWEVEEVV